MFKVPVHAEHDRRPIIHIFLRRL